MDTTEIVLQILYTLIFAIAAFGLRGKWPDNFYIGCSLCLFAPAWGQFYKKSKYGIIAWMIFMAIERGVMKSVDDLSSILVSWIVVGSISAGVMFYRISSTGQSESSQSIEKPLSDKSDNTQHRLSIVEVGVSRIGVILGIIASLMLPLVLIIDNRYIVFQNNKIFTFCINASASICLGLFVWGLTVVAYRIFLWVKFGFSTPDLYNFKNVIKINSKLQIEIFAIFLAALIVQYYYSDDFVNRRNANRTFINPINFQSVSSCEDLLKEADGVRMRMERYLKIYGRYPSNLEVLWSKFPADHNYSSLSGYYGLSIATHITLLNKTNYSISFTENRCNRLYRIESKQVKILYEDLR